MIDETFDHAHQKISQAGSIEEAYAAYKAGQECTETQLGRKDLSFDEKNKIFNNMRTIRMMYFAKVNLFRREIYINNELNESSASDYGLNESSSGEFMGVGKPDSKSEQASPEELASGKTNDNVNDIIPLTENGSNKDSENEPNINETNEPNNNETNINGFSNGNEKRDANAVKPNPIRGDDNDKKPMDKDKEEREEKRDNNNDKKENNNEKKDENDSNGGKKKEDSNKNQGIKGKDGEKSNKEQNENREEQSFADKLKNIFFCCC
ncbi:hypothetical protein ENBRE01_1996 [Enteropsectra breve]|nr:hypothetical protein ENBRE01_1996 [Enteropsectra breve]